MKHVGYAWAIMKDQCIKKDVWAKREGENGKNVV